MKLQDYLRLFRERWATIVVAVVVGVGAAVSLYYVQPKQYTAETTLYVSAQTNDTASAAYEGAQLSQQRVTSYVQLVTSQRVASEVVQRLHLGLSAEQLAKNISATSTQDSVLIYITVAGSTPDSAAAVANAVATAFIGLVDEIERPTTPDARSPVVVRVVEPAAVPGSPSSSGLGTLVALGLLVNFENYML